MSSRLSRCSLSIYTSSLDYAGMAEDGYLPECFARRSRFDTPWAALLLITALVLVLSLSSSFSSLISMLNAVYCMAQASDPRRRELREVFEVAVASM